MKNVQIILERTKGIETMNEPIERFRKRLEEHINNGWEIKTTNIMANSNHPIILIGTLIKE